MASAVEFVIEQVVAQGGRSKVVVFARQVAGGAFHVGGAARLGGVPVQPEVNQPRVLMQDGAPRPDIFAFTLVESSDAARLSIGQTVALELESAT